MAEATGISLQGLGWPYAAGLWTDAQIEGWRAITSAVHAEGGRIFTQLWHMGRVVHPSMPGRGQPVSASATTAPGLDHTYGGKQPHTQARALRTDEIPALLEDYRQAARNALVADFDGAQIHSANGYVLDQSLRDSTNLRTDEYGGPAENRVRLLLEVTQTVAGMVGADRTSVRISPNEDRRGVRDSDPHHLFATAATGLSKLGIAFLDVREPGAEGTFSQAQHPPVAPAIRRAFAGPLVLNSDYGRDSAQHALDTGAADAIGFGRPFTSNPDLPLRLAEGIPLAADDMATWYTQGREGYLNYSAAVARRA